MDLEPLINEIEKLRRAERRMKRRQVFARPTRRFKDKRFNKSKSNFDNDEY